MTKKTHSDSISIDLLNYPQSLLLGNQDYELKFSVKNNSESKESYAFNFTSTTSDITVDKSFSKGESINPGETKIIPVSIKPKIEGLTELNIIVYHQKKVEFKSMDWKIRKNVEKSIVSKIIEKSKVNYEDLLGYKKKLPKSISFGDIPSISKSKAKKEVEKIISATSIKVHTREIKREVITRIPKTITKQVPEKVIKRIPKVIEEMVQQEPLINAISGKKIQRPPLKTTKTVYDSVEEIVMKTVTETVYEEKIETKVEIIEDTSRQLEKGEITLEQKDEMLSNLAKGVFNHDPQYAFKIIKMISDPNKRYPLISQFTPPGIRLDSKATIEAVMGMDLGTHKESLIEIIANSLAAEKPDEAAMIALNIDSVKKRDAIITNIIYTTANLKPQIASNLIYQLSNKELQQKILFELVKGWAKNDKKRAIESLKSLISNILSESNTELIKTCMIFLAYLTDPQSVYDLIEGFDSKDEKAILIQEINKLYFTFTAISQKITPEIKYLAEIKGNISSNLIEGNITSNIIVICPFKFDFPVFMNIQRCYVELLQETQKTFGFLLFPSKENYNEEELKHFTNILKNFIANQSKTHPSPFVVINLDLIPYFSKPTIFLGDNGDPLVKDIHSKLKDNFNAEVNVMINNSFFSQGKSLTDIKDILKEPKFRICNIILTYNFLNEINLLKTFLKAIL